ncbi:LOW QUALITY PROTEIN: hypothetical protein ACHAWU_001368 [Discostella pseudostelligera]|uniref:peptidylprolyl isomerase n=1 Tax=Discostella pseudostelligera TaxID=259834 RepID=A0ABD3MES0_9STRA
MDSYSGSITKKRRLRQDDNDDDNNDIMPSTTSRQLVQQLQDVPTTHHYQVSYMHKQTVTHACTSLRHGYVITGSADGVVKFWKRTSTSSSSSSGAPGSASHGAAAAAASAGGGGSSSSSSRCLEFVKSYSSHVGPLLALITSQPNGDSAVSIGYDGTIKFYDVATFDVSGMIRTTSSSSSSSSNTKMKFRLGRHAALMEREDLYLLVSTRAPTREEWQVELREEKEMQLLRQQHHQQQQQRQKDDNDDDDEDTGPLPQKPNTDTSSNKQHTSGSSNSSNNERTGVLAGSILLFSGTNLSPDPLRIISYHAAPVTAMSYHTSKHWVVSGDASGVLEVWNVPLSPSMGDGEDGVGSGGSIGQQQLPFESKFDTDLYALIKKKTYAIDIAISEGMTPGASNNSSSSSSGIHGHFAVYASDRKIRLFTFHGCKLVCMYDERFMTNSFSKKSSSTLGIDMIEYGKRKALECEMEDTYLLSGGVSTNPSTKQSYSTVMPSSEGNYHQRIHITFDNSGQYLLIPTIVGIKVINIQTHRVVATVGKGDASAVRFIHLCLCPGDAKINQQMQLARMGGSSAAIQHGGSEGPNDSLLIALAYGKRRFYAFSHHDPLSSHDQVEPGEDVILARDILNEAPDASDLLEATHLGRSNNNDEPAILTTASKAILRTTHGDISIKLFKDTPRTIQNFVGHAQSGYYDNVIFHRIIPGFMIQTGDPLGDGTGGESIWGGEFEDEIRRDLRHDRPFTVSMANAGPNTNGSQFFITTVPTPWLDNKHTVFGRVVGGMEVVMAIEGVKTDELDRPLSEVKILSIDLS